MARIEVPMPQMGESIAEGTVSKWLKSLGDTVERDEAILEISTDKVDAEIPAPSAGTLVSIEVQEGETVEVGTIVAYIDPDGGAPEGDGGGSGDQADEDSGDSGEQEAAEDDSDASFDDDEKKADRPAAESKGSGGDESEGERLRTKSTPVVRRIAEEHGVDISSVEGSGHAGRVTKQDILGFIERGEKSDAPRPAASAPAEPAKPATEAPKTQPAAAGPVDMDAFWKQFYTKVQHPEFPVREADTVEPMDKIRRLTAEHMVVAKRIAPHVHSFIEIDFTAIDRIRAAKKPEWAAKGARVSYTAFVAYAVSRIIRKYPTINGTVSGNNIIHRGNVNVGIAVDLDPGLIVPVMHDTDDLGLVGIGKRIIDLADRARNRQLQPSDIQGATFSITNPGVLGTMVGMPVIPKGTSAILGTGSIEKRVVVVQDATGADTIAIRKRSYFSLGYDHRLVDGADAARFLAELKEYMESFPEDA